MPLLSSPLAASSKLTYPIKGEGLWRIFVTALLFLLPPHGPARRAGEAPSGGGIFDRSLSDKTNTDIRVH